MKLDQRRLLKYSIIRYFYEENNQIKLELIPYFMTKGISTITLYSNELYIFTR